MPSGLADLVTGAPAGSDANANDVDGLTSARSRQIDLGGGRWTVSFRFTFAHDAGASSADYLRLSVVHGSTTTPLWTTLGKAAERNARWRTKAFSLSAYAGQQIRLLFEAVDGDADNIVEAAIDDLRVYQTP